MVIPAAAAAATVFAYAREHQLSVIPSMLIVVIHNSDNDGLSSDNYRLVIAKSPNFHVAGTCAQCGLWNTLLSALREQ